MTPAKAWAERLKRWQKLHDEKYAKLILSPPDKITLRRAIPVPCVAIVMGARGSGKSGFSYWIMGEFHRLYKMGGAILYPGGKLPPAKAKLLPAWVKVVGDINALPKKSVCLIDEAAQQAHARRSQSGKNISFDNLVSMSRQRNQVILWVTHHSRKLDLNIIHDADRVIWKRPSEAHAIFEREEIQQFTWKAFEYFDSLTPKTQLVSCLVMNFQKLSFSRLRNALPTWWSDGLSRLWS